MTGYFRRYGEINRLVVAAAAERRAYDLAQTVYLAMQPAEVEVTEVLALELVGQPTVALDELTPARLNDLMESAAVEHATGGTNGLRQ